MTLPFAVRCIAIFGIKSIFHILIKFTDVFDLIFRYTFRAFHSDCLSARCHKTTCFIFVTLSKLKFKQISARDIFRIVWNIYPFLCACFIIICSFLLICFQICIIICLTCGIFQIRNVDSRFSDFDFFCDKIRSHVIAIDIKIDVSAVHGEWNPGLFCQIVHDPISKKRTIRIISKQTPAFSLAHSKQI